MFYNNCICDNVFTYQAEQTKVIFQNLSGAPVILEANTISLLPAKKSVRVGIPSGFRDASIRYLWNPDAALSLRQQILSRNGTTVNIKYAKTVNFLPGEKIDVIEGKEYEFQPKMIYNTSDSNIGIFFTVSLTVVPFISVRLNPGLLRVGAQGVNVGAGEKVIYDETKGLRTL